MVKSQKPKFYAVVKGRHTGIYRTADEYQRHMRGSSGVIGKSFSTREAAQLFIRMKSGTRQNGHVQASPVRIPLRETTPINLSSNNANASVWYYAVAIGREPGVYGSWPECEAQVEDYEFAKFRKFSSLVEANTFVSQFAVKPVVNYMPSKSIAIAYCDGISRPNPETGDNISSYGAVVFDKNGQRIFWISAFLDVGHTCFTAEYSGLIQVLKAGTGLGIKELKVIMDCKLVEKQMIGVYKVNSERLLPFYEKAKQLESNYKVVKYEHALKDGNKAAEAFATLAIERQPIEIASSHKHLSATSELEEILRKHLSATSEIEEFIRKHMSAASELEEISRKHLCAISEIQEISRNPIQLAERPIVVQLPQKRRKEVPQLIAMAYCAASYKPNPEKGDNISSFGAVIVGKNGKKLFAASAFLESGHTIRTAEYSGLIQVLKAGTGLGIKKLKIVMDSEWVVGQMTGVYNVTSERLVPFYEKAKQFESNYEEVEYENAQRAGNEKANSLATIAIQRQRTGFSKSHSRLSAISEIEDIQRNPLSIVNSLPKPQINDINLVVTFRCLKCGSTEESVNTLSQIEQQCQDCLTAEQPNSVAPMEGAQYSDYSQELYTNLRAGTMEQTETEFTFNQSF